MNTKLPNFLAVDFYCGAGGSTQGLIDAGGYVVAGIDRDESNRQTYQFNNRNLTLGGGEPAFLALDIFPACPEYPQGQQQEVLDTLGRLVPRYRKQAAGAPLLFVICAPCQSFTKYVQRRLTTQRTQSRERDLDLLSQTIGFIERFQPELIISENVASLPRGPYRIVWRAFQDELRRLGYAVEDSIVCASQFGVPQYRRRSILFAAKSGPAEGFRLDLAIPDRDPKARTITVCEAIGHLPPLHAGERRSDIANHVCRNLSETNRLRLMSVKPGETNFQFAESDFGDLSLACHRRLAAKGIRGFGDVYTRMRPDLPAPTLTTRFHSVSNGRFGHFDEEQVRALSLHEGAILQSFREDYLFIGSSMASIARMVGNAVPPRLTAYMASWLLQTWQSHGIVARNYSHYQPKGKE